MGARRRRLNKEALGIFSYGGGFSNDDEESAGPGGGGRTRRARQPPRRRETEIIGVPLVVWCAWGFIALVGFLLFKYQHLL